MLQRVEVLPNEPGHYAAVVRYRTAHNPMTLQPVRVASRYFVVSARFVSPDAFFDERERTAVTWRLVAALDDQDDQGFPDRDAWMGRDDDIDVPADVEDARPYLERKLRSEDCEWYLWPR